MRYQVQVFQLKTELNYQEENEALQTGDVLYKTMRETEFIRVVDTEENVVVNEYSKRP